MTSSQPHQAYAHSLQADLQAAPRADVPRRDVLLGWLEDFLRRAAAKGFALASEDLENLIALDKFVRVNRIPATVRVAL